MQLRPLVTAAAVLALAAPLSSCGFDYATERDYTPASGANNREGDVDVLSAVVVSAAEGSGTFVASFSNNDAEEEQTFSGVSGDEGASIEAAAFDPIEIPAGGLVNLADPAADIVLTGDFKAGDFVPLAVDFGNGDRITLNVPVVSDDTGYWEGMDAS
jgi:copper(I)-binding protein